MRFSPVFFLWVSLFFPSSLLLALERRPPVSSTDTKVEARWIRDGVETPLFLTSYSGQVYWPLQYVARVAQAQVYWGDSQACLSRQQEEICFNWKKQKVFSGSYPLGKSYALIKDAADVFVPSKFMSSMEFSKFSTSELTWDSRQLVLTQITPLRLVIPAAENMGDRYRFTMNVSPQLDYYLLAKNTNEIWIRYLHAQTEGSHVIEGDSIVNKIRVRQHRRSADVIFGLGAQALSSDVFVDSAQNKLVVDIFYSIPKARPTPSSIKPVPVASVARKRTPKQSTVKKMASPVPVTDKQVRTIVIDAGHGGIDSGALGVRGTMEKDINLKAAIALGALLKKEPHTRVLLTREKDDFVSLKDRTEFAIKAKADLFISIHCNSSLSSKAAGFEVYVLAADATDEAAAAVARIENSVLHLEADGLNKGERVNELLAAMAVTSYINESTKLAGNICRHVKQKSTVKETSIREANFFVLRGAQMPGVLVELDYLSNPITETKLRSSRHLSQVVKGIADGILVYERSLRAALSPRVAEAKESAAKNLK